MRSDEGGSVADVLVVGGGSGPDPGGGAVVDARGRVHGIEHLHVADASVMPAIPSANTNLPTIMIAERVACWTTTERHEP
jgi:choline dehydrogenase-like flavoprotein